MEREILFTGIGGQGVQLASKILALAALREDRQVMSLGTYGGTMRGGNTDSTVVIGDGPLVSPPIVSRGWAGVVVHPRYWEPVRSKLRPASIVAFDRDLTGGELPGAGSGALCINATGIAKEVEAPMSVSLVLLAAFCRATGLVGLPALIGAMTDTIPPYRSQHIETNRRALEAGSAAVKAAVVDAWAKEAA
jgi:Pyruvate/2-oxoacid:ferredoxin oxidoreductase gamma subunit